MNVMMPSFDIDTVMLLSKPLLLVYAMIARGDSNAQIARNVILGLSRCLACGIGMCRNCLHVSCFALR